MSLALNNWAQNTKQNSRDDSLLFFFFFFFFFLHENKIWCFMGIVKPRLLYFREKAIAATGDQGVQLASDWFVSSGLENYACLIVFDRLIWVYARNTS